MEKVYDRQETKMVNAKALTQSNIDSMGLSREDAARFNPGWYWISVWPSFENGRLLAVFTPFEKPDEDIAVFLKVQEVL